MENKRLTRAPILVKNLCTVFHCKGIHISFSFYSVNDSASWCYLNRMRTTLKVNQLDTVTLFVIDRASRNSALFSLPSGGCSLRSSRICALENTLPSGLTSI